MDHSSLCTDLAAIPPIDVRVGVYLWGDTDVVSHAYQWSKRLGVDMTDILETRCQNTVNYMLLLFRVREWTTTGIDSLYDDVFNFHIVTLQPTEYMGEDHRVSHTYVVIRQGSEFIVVDSYAAHYGMTVRCMDSDSFKRYLDTCVRFVGDINGTDWFEITGVKADITYSDSYEIVVESSRVNDRLSVTESRKRLYTECIELALDESIRNKYVSDELTTILGWESPTDMVEGTLKVLWDLHDSL